MLFKISQNSWENTCAKSLFFNKPADPIARRCSVKEVLLKILQNLQENTCPRASVLTKFNSLCFDNFRNFAKLTGKHLHLSLFLNKVVGLQLYWKRNSGTGVFQWILQNFEEHLFYRTPPGDRFWSFFLLINRAKICSYFCSKKNSIADAWQGLLFKSSLH